MLKGRVKWFNDLKGYGFIEGSPGEPDVFVHHRAIEGDGFRSLLDGEEGLYKVEDGPKGPSATRVIRKDFMTGEWT